MVNIEINVLNSVKEKERETQNRDFQAPVSILVQPQGLGAHPSLLG